MGVQKAIKKKIADKKNQGIAPIKFNLSQKFISMWGAWETNFPFTFFIDGWKLKQVKDACWMIASLRSIMSIMAMKWNGHFRWIFP